MLHVSRAHLRYDPQGYVSRDVGEVPTLPRNARDITMRYRTPPRGPARTASDRPSSSRSSGSSYYQRPGSGNWGAPRPPTRLPEAQCASLVSSAGTGYLLDNPGMVSPHRGTRLHRLPFLIVFFFSPIPVEHTIWRLFNSPKCPQSSAPRLCRVCHWRRL
jgi:hypothetical protein